MSSTQEKKLLTQKKLQEKRERLKQLRALRARKKLEAENLLQAPSGTTHDKSAGSSDQHLDSTHTTDDTTSWSSISPRGTPAADTTSINSTNSREQIRVSNSREHSSSSSATGTTLSMSNLISIIDMEPSSKTPQQQQQPEIISFSKGVEVNMDQFEQNRGDALNQESPTAPPDEDEEEEEASSLGALTPRNAPSQTTPQQQKSSLTQQQIQEIEASPQFHHFLSQGTKYMERILNHKFDPLVDYTHDTRPALGKKDSSETIVFREETFSHDFSQGRTVTAFDWSNLKPELILVAYANAGDAAASANSTSGGGAGTSAGPGASSASPSGGGVLIWSRYLPKRPEFELHASSPVTRALFHPYNVNLILGATKAGHIVQWDLGVASHPVQQTPIAPEYHTHQICGLKSVGTRHSPTIVSICTACMVCVWSLSNFGKPIQHLSLSERVPKSSSLGVHTTAYCFSFLSGQELSRFYVGTESGAVYSCELYGKAKVDRELHAHHGPVMALDFHPLAQHKDLMLTCGVDWTVRLWSTKQHNSDTALYVFSEYTDYIYDVKWSPVHAAVFATVDGDGYLKVWNLDRHQSMPVYSKKMDESRGAALNQLMFSLDGSMIVVGSIHGDVYLLGLEESLWKVGSEEWKDFDSWVKKQHILATRRV